MEGCPLSKSKFEGACATCAQVDDCVFLGLAKMIEEVKMMLRETEKRLDKLESNKKK
jgi:hypothetical protein